MDTACIADPWLAWPVPWSREQREYVRLCYAERRRHPLRMITVARLANVPEWWDTVAAIADTSAIVLPPDVRVEVVPAARATVLGQERQARARQCHNLCRKCRGRGTKRHHAMCDRNPWSPRGDQGVIRRLWKRHSAATW